MTDIPKGIPFSSADEGIDFPTQAKLFVLNEINHSMDDNVAMHEIYVVSFTYILGGWKAMVSTSVPDGKYYEVTHNASKKETYVDTYVKVHNTKYTLEGEPNA